ncbi:hypothetical protein C491_06023 [Natronococcus amylolyticus DSM 10524]|uniref:Uncharacterized protein n=1 Tax=Natronococcus amylolyticus DSM 10524 TaxID=1227497 RepID=L9XF85_9EURY|nr:hypothetical protein C491_06023 [Natronococcus amylolyticus DSM 10524]
MVEQWFYFFSLLEWKWRHSFCSHNSVKEENLLEDSLDSFFEPLWSDESMGISFVSYYTGLGSRYDFCTKIVRQRRNNENSFELFWDPNFDTGARNR